MLATLARFVIYLYGMTLVGIIFMFALTNPHSGWNSIGKVQGTVTELFYVYPNIYVKSSDDLYYACDPHQKRCSPVDSSDVPGDSSDEICWSKPEIDLSQAPGEVVASSVISSCGAHGTIERHMIALDNGAIWVRYHSWNAYSAMVCPALGGFIGFVFGVLVFLRSLKHGTQEKSKR